MKRTVDLAPHPAILVQAMRHIGYTLDTALADIIDNSLAANAEKISVRFAWNNGVPWLAVLDNGHGMSESKLHDAMRFGGETFPESARAVNDLGRFGLGLKTASLSQCRRLTVVSKQNSSTSTAHAAGDIATCAWDVDTLSRAGAATWQAEIPSLADLERDAALAPLLAALQTQENGTLVLWQKLDKIANDSKSANSEKYFNEPLARAQAHIRTTFHRYLSPENGKRAVVIDFNNAPLEPFNPFGIAGCPARQELPSEKITVHGEKIEVHPYILPHYTKIDRQNYERFGGEEGYLHNQGFYIYRNRRLILKGTWFRLVPKNELTKLIRVRVDIPNTLDHIWDLDIKKSQAHPPQIVLEELKRVIARIADAGKGVYKRKAAMLLQKIVPVWRREVRDGKICYVINEKHPLAAILISDFDGKINSTKLSALHLISDMFPKDAFHADANDDTIEIGNITPDDEMLSVVKTLIDTLRTSGFDTKQLREKLQEIALPVSTEILEQLLEKSQQEK